MPQASATMKADAKASDHQQEETHARVGDEMGDEGELEIRAAPGSAVRRLLRARRADAGRRGARRGLRAAARAPRAGAGAVARASLRRLPDLLACPRSSRGPARGSADYRRPGAGFPRQPWAAGEQAACRIRIPGIPGGYESAAGEVRAAGSLHPQAVCCSRRPRALTPPPSRPRAHAAAGRFRHRAGS